MSGKLDRLASKLFGVWAAACSLKIDMCHADGQLILKFADTLSACCAKPCAEAVVNLINPEPDRTTRCNSHLKLAGRAKGCALVNLRLQRFVDLLVGGADNGRAPAANVVDVLVAVHVEAVRPLCSQDVCA